MDDHEKWRESVAEHGGRPTPVIDRFYFKSIYFREPSGVLFEIATMGPGFAVDEDLATLGEKVALPPQFEPHREQIEANLRPVVSPRERARTS
jgi:glyoxalase family protein